MHYKRFNSSIDRINFFLYVVILLSTHLLVYHLNNIGIVYIKDSTQICSKFSLYDLVHKHEASE